MQINNQLKTAHSGRARQSTPTSSDTISDRHQSALPLELSDLGPQVQAASPFASPEEVMELQAPHLQRPVLLVHGLAKHADYWVNMKNWLCSESGNQFGGVIRNDQPDKFAERLRNKPGSNVFSIEFSDNTASPVKLGTELRQAISKIRALTGATKVDVVTHSQGGLDAREALAQGERGIGHLCMIAPPNQGSYLADIALWATAAHATNIPQDKTGGLDYLRVRENLTGSVNNPQLDRLNQRWPSDRQFVDSANILASHTVATVDRSWTMTSGGDGLVTTQRTLLDDTPVQVAIPQQFAPGEPGYNGLALTTFNHEALGSNPLAYRFVAEILTQPAKTTEQSG